MDLVGVILGWLVTLGCIYAAYLGVRELEQSVVRRPFSSLLTLVLVYGAAGILFLAVNNFSGYLLQDTYNVYYYYHTWPSIVELVLVIGAGVLIQRDVLLRVRQGPCPQCGTPLMGHSSCPNCGWGSIRLPMGLTTMVQRPAGPTRPASGEAPTVRALSTNPSPAAAPSAPAAAMSAATGGTGGAGQSATFCMMCGATLTKDQTFCGQCGASTPANS